MKVFILISIFVGSLFAQPTWYHQIINNDPNKYIGYGEGKSIAKAKEGALADIVSQISTNVSISITKEKENVNGSFKTNDKQISSQSSKAVIKDYKLLKSHVQYGIHYVALGYENVPSLNKFVTKVIARGIPIDTFQNSYLKNTLMSKKLKKHFKQDINFELSRRNKQWNIKYGATVQELDKKDFSKFFTSVENKNLQIKLDKKRKILYDGETFYFEIKSIKKGFVSVLTVYEDGTVSTLVRNIPINKNVKENVPDKDFETIPEAGLMQTDIETYDLYVAIFSTNKMKFDQFAYADSSLINEEKYKNFGELIEILQGKEYTTLKVVTKPKKR